MWPDVEHRRCKLICTHLRCPGQEALDALMWRVIPRETENVGMPHPPRNCRPCRIGKLSRGIDVGRATGSRAQILVSTADGEIGIRTFHIDRNGSGRMRQIPHRKSAFGMCGSCHTGHVPALA